MTAPALVQKLWNYCNILPGFAPFDRLRATADRAEGRAVV